MSTDDQQDVQALILERLNAFTQQLTDFSSRMTKVGERVDTLAQTVALVQHDVIRLKKPQPAQPEILHPIDEETPADLLNEELADAAAAAEDKVSTHSSGDKEALQMLLDRFSSDQRAERELRSQEFQTLMGLLVRQQAPPAYQLYLWSATHRTSRSMTVSVTIV